MSRPLLFPVAVALAAAVSGLCAQRTWVVAANGGPGVDFTDVPPAIAAANDGDVIVVRSGAYSAAMMDGKGVTLVGETDVVLANLLVTNLTAGQAVVVGDVAVYGPFTLVRPGAADCLGRVLFERVQFGPANASGGIRARFDRVADLRLSSCAIHAGADFADTQVTLTDSTAEPPPFVSAGPTLTFGGGAGVMSRCSVSGPSEFLRVVPAEAIRMNGAALTITDDGSHLIAAGQATTVAQPSAITGSGALLRDPRVRLIADTAPPVSGPTDTVRPIASLQVLGPHLGRAIEVDLAGPTGEVFALVLGLPGPLLPLPHLGGSVGLGTLSVVAQGVFTASPFHLSIPARAPLPRGFTIAWQAVAGDTMGGAQLSNFATYARTD